MSNQTSPGSTSVKGPYASADFPLLGAVAAICCGTTEERLLFSQSEDPESFCTDRYGLNDEQTALLLAPKAGDTVPCVPDEQQIAAVVNALEAEFANTDAPTSKQTQREPFDATRAARYPTVVKLYNAYVLGTEARPENYRTALTQELSAHPENIW